MAVEADQDRRDRERADEGLDSRRGDVRVAIEARDEVAGALTGEEAHRQPEQVTEEIGLHRGSGPYANPEGEQVVAEIERALEHADGYAGNAQNDDRAEAILAADPEPVQHHAAEVLERKRACRGRRA